MGCFSFFTFSISSHLLPSEDVDIGNVGGLIANEVCALLSGWQAVLVELLLN